MRDPHIVHLPPCKGSLPGTKLEFWKCFSKDVDGLPLINFFLHPSGEDECLITCNAARLRTIATECSNMARAIEKGE